jgi:hypothetical protein
MHFERLRRSTQSHICYEKNICVFAFDDYRSCDKAGCGFLFYGPALYCPFRREGFNESHKLGSRILLRPTSILRLQIATWLLFHESCHAMDCFPEISLARKTMSRL